MLLLKQNLVPGQTSIETKNFEVTSELKRVEVQCHSCPTGCLSKPLQQLKRQLSQIAVRMDITQGKLHSLEGPGSSGMPTAGSGCFWNSFPLPMGSKEKGLEMHYKLCFLSKESIQDFANNRLAQMCLPGCPHFLQQPCRQLRVSWLESPSLTKVHQHHSPRLLPFPSTQSIYPTPEA